MDKVGIDVALIGRNSRCKTAFLKAASASDLANDALEAQVWWTSSFTPSRTDLVQAPEHGFSPSGNRLLPARLRHTLAADVMQTSKEHNEPLLLVMSADAIFHKGKLRSGGAQGPSCVHAVVSRMKERFRGHKPFAVALSVDIDEIGEKTVSSAVKTILASVKEELALDGVPVVAVTPQTELWLREQVGEGGRVSYTRGDTYFRIPSAFELMMDRNDIAKARAAFDICGGTGIMAALSAAVALAPPTIVFPVGDFTTLESSGWGGEGSPTARLRTCRLLRASSTARDVFAVEKSCGIYSGGDVSEAEVMPASVEAISRKDTTSIDLDEPIGAGAWVIRLVSSHKAVKVWKEGAAGAGFGGKTSKPLASVQLGDLRSKERRRGRS